MDILEQLDLEIELEKPQETTKMPFVTLALTIYHICLCTIDARYSDNISWNTPTLGLPSCVFNKMNETRDIVHLLCAQSSNQGIGQLTVNSFLYVAVLGTVEYKYNTLTVFLLFNISNMVGYLLNYLLKNYNNVGGDAGIIACSILLDKNILYFFQIIYFVHEYYIFQNITQVLITFGIGNIFGKPFKEIIIL